MAAKFDIRLWKGLKNPFDFLRIIFNLPKFIKLFFRLFRDHRVATYPKIILVLALIYVISPVDLIPDWLFPIIGEVDDLIILVVASKYFLKSCPPEVVQEQVERIERGL